MKIAVLPKSRTGWLLGIALILALFWAYYFPPFFFFKELQDTYYKNYLIRQQYQRSISYQEDNYLLEVHVEAPAYVSSFLQREMTISIRNSAKDGASIPAARIQTFDVNLVVIAELEGQGEVVLPIQVAQSNSLFNIAGSNVISFGQIPYRGVVTRQVWIRAPRHENTVANSSLYSTDSPTRTLALTFSLLRQGETIPVKNLNINSNNNSLQPNSTSTLCRSEPTKLCLSIDPVATINQSFIQTLLLPPWSNGILVAIALFLAWILEWLRDSLGKPEEDKRKSSTSHKAVPPPPQTGNNSTSTYLVYIQSQLGLLLHNTVLTAVNLILIGCIVVIALVVSVFFLDASVQLILHSINEHSFIQEKNELRSFLIHAVGIFILLLMIKLAILWYQQMWNEEQISSHPTPSQTPSQIVSPEEPSQAVQSTYFPTRGRQRNGQYCEKMTVQNRIKKWMSSRRASSQAVSESLVPPTTSPGGSRARNNNGNNLVSGLPSPPHEGPPVKAEVAKDSKGYTTDVQKPGQLAPETFSPPSEKSLAVIPLQTEAGKIGNDGSDTTGTQKVEQSITKLFPLSSKTAEEEVSLDVTETMGDSDKLSDQQNDRLSTMLNVMLRFEPQISSLVSKIDTDAKLRSQLLNNKNDAVSKFQLILWRAKNLVEHLWLIHLIKVMQRIT
jgi:hypothetical protein